MINVDINSVIGTIAVISGILLPWFVYKRGGKAIKISEETGIASEKTQGVAQAFEGLQTHIAGLNSFIAVLQADTKIDREDIKACSTRSEALQKELNRMYRKYGENGQSNGH